jgi:hypothetical protein
MAENLCLHSLPGLAGANPQMDCWASGCYGNTLRPGQHLLLISRKDSYQGKKSEQKLQCSTLRIVLPKVISVSSTLEENFSGIPFPHMSL